MNKVAITFNFREKKIADLMYDSINIEIGSSKTKRGKANIEKDETKLIIEIIADDLIAMRAIMNSILRLLGTSYDISLINLE